MNRFFKKLELLVDRIIPWLLVLLAVIIILDIFFTNILEPYHFYVDIIDYIIIAFFVVDLVFKYGHAKSTARFLKKYWLEIIAVLPVFVVARIIEEAVGLFLAAEDIARTQRVIHGAVEFEEESKRIAAELGRSRRFMRLIRPLARLPRFAKAFKFYKKPGN